MIADRLQMLDMQPPRSRDGRVIVGSPQQARGRAQLGQAKSRSVGEFKDCVVAKILGVGIYGRLEQSCDFRTGEIFRQILPTFG